MRCVVGATRRRRKSASVKRACSAFAYFVKDQARRMSEFSPVRLSPLDTALLEWLNEYAVRAYTTPDSAVAYLKQ